MRPLFLVLFVALINRPAMAVDYFPLTEGVVRAYNVTTTTQTNSYSTLFSGTIEVNGTTAHILQYSGEWNSNLQQYWSETSEGDKLFHGFKLPHLEIIWTPPILWMDMPLTVGKAWETQTQGSGGETAHIQMEVVAMGDVTVPAGTFSAVTIEWIDSTPLPTAKGHLMTGVSATKGGHFSGMPTVNSFSDVAGQLTRVLPTITEELVSIGVVAIEQTTWSQVRQLFR